ncbi:hypothetical protein M408DRAFT_12483 [Serendipita vermifera MAFF 305830]|uniref:Uncharacterized protein n=1 Tax=Serendipita vermifera MAFF 305830 TaxID=933852 RepID=A0A0C3AQT5_SERVB|nr:hypothetical protein M408DRAFT_12483 [Serendipita vermifera MAFF 305830]
MPPKPATKGSTRASSTPPEAAIGPKTYKARGHGKPTTASQRATRSHTLKEQGPSDLQPVVEPIIEEEEDPQPASQNAVVTTPVEYRDDEPTTNEEKADSMGNGPCALGANANEEDPNEDSDDPYKEDNTIGITPITATKRSGNHGSNSDDSFYVIEDVQTNTLKRLAVQSKKPAGTVATQAKGKGKATGQGRGRPPAMLPPPQVFEIVFKIKINSVNKYIRLHSDANLIDLHDQASNLLKKRNHEINLRYMTCWTPKGEKWDLDSAPDWMEMVNMVRKNLHRKTTTDFHIELLDASSGQAIASVGSTSSGSGGPSGSIAGSTIANSAATSNANGADEQTATSFLGRIQARHNCESHGYECYVIKNRLYEPKFKLRTHKRILLDVLLQWAEDCVAGEASVGTVPKAYIPRILGLENEDDSDGPLTLPEVKPRGRSGPNPAPSGPSNDAAAPPTGTMIPTSSGWPPFAYPPYPYPAYPPYAGPNAGPSTSPVRTQGGLNAGPSTSPVRTSTRGPRLRDFLQMLDDDAESDEESYNDLLGALKGLGIHRVKDFNLWNAPDLRDELPCPLGTAKRLLNEAKIALRG